MTNDFTEKVHKEALKFRQKKIKEALEKEEQGEMEIVIIKFWIRTYGKETY